MIRLTALLAAIVVALLAISGAGGAPAQTPKRGGTVVVGPFAEPSCMNPVDDDCEFFSYMAKVLEPAFVLGPDFTPRPQLVSGASVTRRQPFTVTFEIDHDAHWSDRIPVTARDFVFTHQSVVRYLKRADQGEHAYVRSVSRLGAKSVRVVFRSRRAGWRWLFAPVLPAHALRGEDLSKIWRDEIANPRTGAPIGSGPFLLQSWKRGEQMTLVRNRNYWGPHTANLDRIVWRFSTVGLQLTPSAEVLEALRRGETDVVQTRDTAIVGDLRRIAGVEVRVAPLNGIDYLFLRRGALGHAALKLKLVRRALAYGIDREAIARSVLGELNASFGLSDNAVLMKNSRYYRPNWERYRYRPALARQLLEQAGCRQGGADRIYICGGQRLSLRFFAPAPAAHRVRALRLMQVQLQRVGVAVEMGFAPAPVFFQQIVPSGDFDGILFAYFSAPDTIGADVHGCGGPANVTGYCQRLVTADLNQSELIIDARQRARVLNRADVRIARDVPLLPLFQVPNVIAFRTTVRNIGSATGHELWNAENWWLAK